MTQPPNNPTSGDAEGTSPEHPGAPSKAPARAGGLLGAGDTLGEFEIQEEIGRGGMGTVYRAHQKSLQRVVALKILAPHVSHSPKAVVRFQREAQAAANLHHSHIVAIHSQGSSDGHFYYAMELIDGVDLSKTISLARASLESADDMEETRAGSRSSLPDSAVGVTITLGAGQADRANLGASSALPSASLEDSAVILGTMPAAQRASEEHFAFIAEQLAEVAGALAYAHARGVIHRDIKPHNLILSKDGRLLITDFGLARVLEQPGVTVTGEFLGSPLYTAPEQIAGDGKGVDHRADIYSLAATMYEWLALRPPFPGTTREVVIGQVLRGQPTPLRLLDPSIPIDLETICLRAMDRHPDRRYQNAELFRDDLRAFLSGRRIRARRAGWMKRALRWTGRHPKVSLGAAAVAIALALTGLSWRVSTVNRQAQSLLTQRESQVEEKAEKLDEQAAQLESLIAAINALSPQELIISGVDLAKKVPDLVERGAQATQARMDALVPTTTEVGTLASIAARVVEDLFRTTASPLDALRIQTLAVDPRLIFLRAAMNAVNPVDGIRRTDPYVRDSSDYTARYLRALLNARAGRYEEMASDAAKLVELRGDDANAHLVRGLADLLVNQWEQSIADCDRALVISESLERAWVVRGLANLQLGLTSEALADFNQALALSPDLIAGRLGRAFAAFIHQQPEVALADCTHVLALEPQNIDALVARGEFYRATFAYDLALKDFQQASGLEGVSLSTKLRILGLALAAQRSLDVRIPEQSVPAPVQSGTASLDDGDIDTAQGSPGKPEPAAGSQGRALHDPLPPQRTGRPKTGSPAVAKSSAWRLLILRHLLGRSKP